MTGTSPGVLALTIALGRQKAATLEIPFADVTALLEYIEEAKRESGLLDDEDHYYAAITEVHDFFLAAKRSGVEPAQDVGMSIAMVAIWAAFNHPKGQGKMKQHVSRLMRDPAAKVHITLSLAATGLSIALANEYVDMSEFTANAPAHEYTQVDFQPLPGADEKAH